MGLLSLLTPGGTCIISTLILGVFPFDQIAHVAVRSVLGSGQPLIKLFGREIIFEVAYSNLCDRGT